MSSLLIIEALNSTWNNAFNNSDIKALSALYAENATLSPGDGTVLVGRSEIERLFSSFVSAGVHNHTIEVVATGGNESVIYQVARWSANGAAVDGKTPVFGGITTSVIVKSEDGKWVTQTHVWNAKQ